MKKLQKIIAIGFTCLMIGSAFSMVGCSDNESETHTHQYTEQIITPTCKTEGYTKHICSCGDFYTDTTTATIEHNGVGTCSMCGLNYYNELVSLIEKHGEKVNDIIRYSIIDAYNEEDGTTLEYSYSLCYDTKDMELYLSRNELISNDGGFIRKNCVIYIDEYGIQNNSFEWEYRDDTILGYIKSYDMSGTLNTTQFSKSTSALEYTSSSFSTADSRTAAKNAATMAKGLIENVLMDILKKSDDKLTVFMLGFVRF